MSMPYPAALALGLVAPWVILLVAGAFGADSAAAADYVGPASVLGACFMGLYAVSVRWAGWLPEHGDLPGYLAGVALAALALLPAMLLGPALVYEEPFEIDVLVPALRATFGFGFGVVALQLVVYVARYLGRQRKAR